MKKKIVIAISVLSIGILYLTVISPMFNIHIPCIFKKITGLNCPGCGMTRAALALLDGDVYQAFRWNMLAFIIAPLLATYFVLEKKKMLKPSKVLMTSMLVMAVLFFILRNTETFGWMAPTAI
ncbi:DUF2752 domain-containing protein [Lederbergia graminis]|uniref:DUF2752 domain-containing protein n=1 Tax=Lederbergia graminis TaxID=735518 RepID=A0ABW0LCH2_9BACI